MQEGDDTVLSLDFNYFKGGSRGDKVQNHIYDHPGGCIIVVDAVGRF